VSLSISRSPRGLGAVVFCFSVQAALAPWIGEQAFAASPDAGPRVAQASEELDPRTSSGPPKPVALAPEEVVADKLREPLGVAVDSTGAIFVSEGAGGKITRIGSDGGRTVVASKIARPRGLAFDPQGRLIFVEEGRGRISRLETTGAKTVLASGIVDPRWVAAASDGTLFISAKGLRPLENESAQGE
jgi:DNA-binding beta-propeller fold protein YncE